MDTNGSSTGRKELNLNETESITGGFDWMGVLETAMVFTIGVPAGQIFAASAALATESGPRTGSR